MKKEDLIITAFERLYPNKNLNKQIALKYSGRFSDYNANVKMTSYNIEFNLSKKWRGVSKEIIIGLLQDLILKINKDKRKTLNTDLYHNFIKSLHHSIKKDKTDPILEASFNRVNEQYFTGLMERPNLVWGRFSKRKLGSYDFHTDTISMSKHFIDKEHNLLDYVMYHEMLHKKFKFTNSGSRNRFHSTEFKKAEKKFQNSEEIEKRLKYIGRTKNKRKIAFFKFFK
ncbi:MAG: SprT-like domain-containing protein [Nanoarchaeota archaeon]|nr:SprT-like domain-containing protein [Nanoarchaeota archaeon]